MAMAVIVLKDRSRFTTGAGKFKSSKLIFVIALKLTTRSTSRVYCANPFGTKVIELLRRFKVSSGVVGATLTMTSAIVGSSNF